MQTLDPSHNGGLSGLLPRPIDIVGLRLNEVPPKQVLEDHIEKRDHLGRVVNKLEIKLPIEFAEMFALDLESDGLVLRQIVQLDSVDLLAHVFVVYLSCDLELEDEALDEGHDFGDLDGRAVDEAFGVGGWFLGGEGGVEFGAGSA